MGAGAGSGVKRGCRDVAQTERESDASKVQDAFLHR